MKYLTFTLWGHVFYSSFAHYVISYFSSVGQKWKINLYVYIKKQQPIFNLLPCLFRSLTCFSTWTVAAHVPFVSPWNEKQALMFSFFVTENEFWSESLLRQTCELLYIFICSFARMITELSTWFVLADSSHNKVCWNNLCGSHVASVVFFYYYNLPLSLLLLLHKGEWFHIVGIIMCAHQR